MGAHNKQIKANQIARRKLREKSLKKAHNLFLGLPGKHTVVFDSNDRRGGKKSLVYFLLKEF